MKEKWAETISQIFFAERINNPNDGCSIFWLLKYREGFKYIISNCLQTLPGRIYYIYFTYVEIKNQKLNVGHNLPNTNVFVSFILQCLCIWVSRNFTLQKLHMNRKQEKKKSRYMVLKWDCSKTHWDPTECSLSAKQLWGLLTRSVACSPAYTLQLWN